MGRAMVARLGLGLLLLALLLPTQIYSDSSTVTPANTATRNNTTTNPNLTNTTTTKASDGALQSTASLLMISFSLLHLYC
uniref:Putative signal transducer cd24-like protein n=1 Tax=Desmodus rotundus TaxID=9430 RepID=K9IW22_DESRO